VEVKRNPIDVIELVMIEWAADVIWYLNYSVVMEICSSSFKEDNSRVKCRI
jgi:hypothetical protein